MDTIVFGHLTWELMTYVAQAVDQHSLLFQDGLLILACMTLLIPCEPCRRFYLSCWCIHPPPESNLMDWVYDIHAIVNAKIRVTKSHSVDPSVCLAPALSRQELQRRYACLSPGSSISLQGFLDFVLITAHGAKRHPKDDRRAQAWRVMLGALGRILANDPYAKPLARAIRATTLSKSKEKSPWTTAVLLSDEFHKNIAVRPPSVGNLCKRLDEACGPLCDWLKGDFGIK